MLLARRVLSAVVVLLLAPACSSSEESRAGISDASPSDSGSDVAQGGTGGSVACQPGSCGSCDTCASWCQCLAAEDYDACLSSCQGGGSGGSAGGGAADGTASGGAGGSPGTPDSVSCNAASCSLSTGQECCYQPWNPAQSQCQNLGKSCSGVRLRCDGPEDCPGRVCCAVPGSGGYGYKQLICRDTCGSGESEVCTSNSDSCTANQQCQASTVLPGQSTCE